MTKYAFAASILAVFLAGCTTDASDDTGSSEDAILGNRPGETYAFDPSAKDEAPLPPLEGEGSTGTVKEKDVVQAASALNVKPVFDIPKPNFKLAE